MKKYLITQSSHTEGNREFVKTFPKLENTLDYINYQRLPFWKENVPDSLIIRIERPYLTHNDKFVNINTDFLEDGYVFFSDTSDVIFQKPIPQTLSGDVIVCSEGLTHDGEPNHGSFWWKYVKPGTKYEALASKTIYNAGLFAMRTEVFREFLAYFKKTLEENLVSQFEDQLIFNHFLHSVFKGSVVEATDIMMCGYKNIELNRMSKKEQWVNEKDEVISICHFNGNSKELL